MCIRDRDYTIKHFGDEEEYMEKIGYSGLEAQKVAHQAFVDRLNEVNLEAVDGDQEGYLRELIEFLLGWLANHILKMDKDVYKRQLLFDVILHLGTLIAIFAVYYKDILRMIVEGVCTVSYTHLDVYKRQRRYRDRSG